jgi:phytoene dehydrogenase-like protein
MADVASNPVQGHSWRGAPSAPVGRRPAQVVVVGAGLAGLSCALDLHRAGVTVSVLEAEGEVGGRARSEMVDGFRLDRGFQVLLSAYPNTRALLGGLAPLRPGSFYSGAVTRYGGALHRIPNPLRHPADLPAAVRSPLVSGQAAAAVLRLLARIRAPARELLSRPEQTAEAELRALGVPEDLLEGFFRPFFGGVFLERELQSTNRMLLFLARMFARAPAVLPAQGMGALAGRLASRLPGATVRLHARVRELGEREVVLQDGEVVAARDAVVIATDGSEATRLAPQVAAPVWRASAVVYLAAERLRVSEPLLYLDADRRGPANSVALLSNVNSAYAPFGRALLSAAIVDPPDQLDAALVASVTRQVQELLEDSVGGLRHLRSERIERALPAQPPGWREKIGDPVRLAAGLYVCGDHREHGSIEGAVLSGRRAAARLLAEMAGRSSADGEAATRARSQSA